MGVVYIKTDQSLQITTGTGAPTHSAVAGDRYTDTATGNTYQYTTSWQMVSYGAGSSVNIYNTDGTLTADRTVSGNSKILTLDNVRREVHNVVPNFNDTTGFIINVNAGALSPFLTSRMFRIVDTNTTTEKFGINVDGNVVINNAYTLPTVAPTSGQVLGYQGVGTTQWTTAGLSFFTEAQSTASPNNLVNVDSLTAVASTTNADFVVRPKGTGAIIAAIPDGTATGGNKRGANAVDLQTTRNQPTYVASGSQSVVLGGYGNKATGSNDTTLGGYFNTAQGSYSVASGFSNTATGTGSFAGGSSSTAGTTNDFAFGQTCNTAGYYGNVAMGYQNTVTNGLASTVFGSGNIVNWFHQFAVGNNHRLTSGDGSVALGKSTMDDGYGRSMYGRAGWVRGDTQSSKIILNRRTTDATASVLVIDSPAGNTPVVGNQMTLQNNNVFRVKGSITGKQSGSTNVGVWDIDCVIVRGANAASTVIAGTPTVSLVVNTGSFGNPTLTANTTLGCLTVTVIGALATNVQWTCVIDTCETIYA